MKKGKRRKPFFFYGVVPAVLFLCLVSLCHGRSERTFRVSVRTNAPPYSFVSWFKGGTSLRGLHIDVLQQVSHHLNAEFNYIKFNAFQTQRKALREGVVDMIGIFRSDGPSPDPNGFAYIPLGLSVTQAIFVHKSCTTVVCAKDLANKKVAIVGGATATENSLKDSKNVDVYRASSPLEALEMLDSKLVDAFIAPSHKVAEYLIQKEGLGNIHKVGLPLATIELGIAVKKDNQALYCELRRAVKRVKSSGMLGQIKVKWYGKEFELTFLEKYYRILLGIFSGVLLVLFFVALLNHQLKKRVKIITRQLQSAESRNRDLIESSPDMIFVVNRKGRIYHMNREAHSFFPTDLSQDTDRADLKDLLPPNNLENLEIFLDAVFTQEKAVKEFQVKDRQSEYREIDIAATLLPSEPSAGQRACLFARDVTQRNRIERDLVQADRMAIIGQMAADVAHEINNPIGIVRANIDLILTRGWFLPEAKEFLDSCQRNTIRAGDFTRDLLAIAKPKTPEMRELNLWEVLGSTLDMMGAQLKRIHITKKQKGEPAIVLGDWNLLQQVLVNLLLNSAVAMKQIPHPELHITCCVPSGFKTVRLRIEDKGVGIPKANLNKIFEPFFTKGKKEGLGLGLFISQRIIKNHNGIIYAESEVDKGTQFIIEIPLIEMDDSNSKTGICETKESKHEV